VLFGFVSEILYMNGLIIGILELGQSLLVDNEEGFLTKDAWIEYANQRFASLDLWFTAVSVCFLGCYQTRNNFSLLSISYERFTYFKVAKRLGWNSKRIKETDPWNVVIVDNTYPLSYFRNQFMELIKYSKNEPLSNLT
jgi:hypothetical protein